MIEDWQPWRDLVSERDTSKLRDKYEEVARRLDAAHVPDLIRLCRNGGDVERRCAFVIMRDLVAAEDPRVGGNQRSAFIDAVTAVARADYPRTPAANSMLRYLAGIDRREAQGIIEAVDVSGLGETEREEILFQAHSFNSPRIVEQLKKMSDGSGTRSARKAERLLEGAGLGDFTKIKVLADRWRATRAPEVLHELYGRYLTHHVGKVTIAEIIELMGPPDDRRGKNTIWYAPNKWVSVYLEGDEKGVLKALKFSG